MALLLTLATGPVGAFFSFLFLARWSVLKSLTHCLAYVLLYLFCLGMFAFLYMFFAGKAGSVVMLLILGGIVVIALQFTILFDVFRAVTRRTVQ